MTFCLMCACGLLLLASGIEPIPGPDTPRTDIPTPCEEPLVTPHRRQTTKSVSDNAGAAPHVNCMQYNRTSPDQPNIPGPTDHQMLNMPRIDTSRLFESGKLLGRPRLAQTRTTSIHRPTIQLSLLQIHLSPVRRETFPHPTRRHQFHHGSIERKLDILTMILLVPAFPRLSRQALR